MKTPHWLNVAIATVTAAGLPACDYFAAKELRPGVSTAAEVRAKLGAPSQEHPNADGTTTLEFSRQPAGTECYMVTIGPDQVMQKLEQVLTEANLARVVTGMEGDAVRRLLGKPGSTTRYENVNEDVWDWHVASTLTTEEAHFHVHFDATSGRVTRTSRRIEPRA